MSDIDWYEEIRNDMGWDYGHQFAADRDAELDEARHAAIQASRKLSPERWEAEREQVAARIYGATGAPISFPMASKPQKQTYRALADAAMTALGFRKADS